MTGDTRGRRDRFVLDGVIHFCEIDDLTADSMIERALPVTSLRALAREMVTDDEHADFREFVADGSVP